jgi:hypothetical protein
MPRRTLAPLDRMKLPLTLAGGLRTAFADVVSTPLPGRPAALAQPIGDPIKPAGKDQDERDDDADADEQIEENDDRAAVDGHVLT